MNLKTTLALLVLVAAGIWLLWTNPPLPPALDPLPQPPAVSDAGTRAVLAELRPEDITRIEVRRSAGTTVLERKESGWQLPGSWPPRAHEVNELVQTLGSLRSRFEPEPLTEEKTAASYGLAPPALTILIDTKSGRYSLALGEKSETDYNNRFSRSTYLRLDDRPEAVRLAPGLIAQLDRPTDYYQKRRLFPEEQVAREPDKPKVEQLAAQSITVKEELAAEPPPLPGEEKKQPVHFTVVRDKDTWKLTKPVSDRLDPASRDALLSAVPDIWAERFVGISPGGVAALAAGPPWNLPAGLTAAFWLTQGRLVQMGLHHPERTLIVKVGKEDTKTLLIGGQAPAQKREVVMPPMPGMPPGMPPRTQTVFDRYRYAMLADNAQVFEVRDDKLKDVFVALDTLRDAQVARFNSGDAQKVEIEHAGETIVLERDKDNKDDWKLRQPFAADADRDKVNDLLGKLSGLQARGKDVLDGASPKAYGLDKPDAVIKVTVEEKKKTGESETRETRTITLRVGKHDTKEKKLYVQSDDWPRINLVEDSLAPLAVRPALAYRGKRVLDFKRSDVAQIDVQEGKESFTLVHQNEGWRLGPPLDTGADMTRGNGLADKLGRLETTEYVNEKPKADELAKYGLDRPAAVVTVRFVDKGKPAQALRIGKSREGKEGRFAQLEGKSGRPAPVFVVAADLYQDLSGGSLAYRPQQIWQLFAELITSVRIRRAGAEEYRLTRDGPGWKISGPFEANALADTVKKMVEDLQEPRCQRYLTHSAKDLADYGLDKPALSVTLTEMGGKEHTLLIGKSVGDKSEQRYAKLGKDTAIMEVASTLVREVDRPALALLDPVLLQLDSKKLERLHSKSGKEALTLTRGKDGWQVTESPAGKFSPDATMTGDVEAVWLNLVADRFAAYGDKVAWDRYGLDRPAFTVTVKDDREHVVELGKPVEGTPGARYARIDHGPGVAVLPAHEAEPLTRTYLDYVERTLLKLDAEAVTKLQRKEGKKVLEINKQDEGWQLVQPTGQATSEQADEPTLQDLVGRLGELRARRVAAFPVKDLADYGLDEPAAVWTVKLKEGKPAAHVLKVGKVADDKTGERFVQVDDGKVVGVLPGKLSRQLTASLLAFRDRNLAQLTDADRLQLERGRRRATFARVEGTWKLSEPFMGEASQNDLDDLVGSLAKLRADELVADSTSTDVLKRYGLDKPEAIWRLYLGDKDVLRIAVGSTDEGGRRRYARLSTRNLVFVLDPQLSERLLAEYRPRTVWKTALDASQVDVLHYGYRDAKSFTLRRSDNTWSAVGDRDARVNTAAVNDTLAALSDLKLLRYVVDKDADRKLYGLETPYLTLDVSTRSGKHTLLIGHTEGESKRRYACMADAERTDVFLLDEATCERIVRDLPSFARAPAAPAGSPLPAIPPVPQP
jgi:hypothetical protein